MKSIKHTLLALVAIAVAFTSCKPVATDIFPTDPVAPVLSAHNDIIVTPTTEADETISFIWEKARNFEVSEYQFYGVKGEDTIGFAVDIHDNVFTAKKDWFNNMLKVQLELENNVMINMSFFVRACAVDGKNYDSNSISVNVFCCDEEPEYPYISEWIDERVLDINDPTSEIDLIKWKEARYGYNITAKYDVMIKVEGGTPYKLAGDITGDGETAACIVTTDALNDAVVTAGGAEGVRSEVNVYVCASAEGKPTIQSEPVTIGIVTYAATFPEKVYLPGSYQGWDPATAPTINVSSVVKGQYEGFVDLNVAGGGSCEFKFCVEPNWTAENFAIDNISIKTETGDYVSVSGSGITGGNITVPSGVYWIKMSKKFKTLQMVQINELDLIGDFCSWDTSKEITLSQDPETHSFVSDNSFTLAEAQSGTGYKVRFNKQWEWSLGTCTSSTGAEYFGLGGDNAKMTLKAGKYSFTLDCSSNPVVPKFISLDMPETLLLAGDYSGHTWTGENAGVNIYLKDADNGIYKGYVTMMYTETPQTWGFKVVKNGTTWIGTSSATSGLQHNLVEGGGENMKPANDHYYVQADMINMTLTLTPLTSVGIIGSFNGWASDVAMTYDQTEMIWSCVQTLAAGDEFKFRFNGDWGYNLGTGGDGEKGLIHEGGNITVAEAGTYTIILDMHNTPSYTMLR